jgi:hypothetical protein
MKLLPVALVALVSACTLAQPATHAAYFLEQQTFRVTHQPDGVDTETPLTMTRDYRSSTGEVRTEYFSIRPISEPPDFRLESVSIFVRAEAYGLDPENHTATDLYKKYKKWLDENVDWFSTSLPAKTAEDLGTRTIFGVVVKGTRTTTHNPAYQSEGHPSVDAYDVVTESWCAQDPPIEMESRTIDPHEGEVVIKTTKFVRGEQDPQLFRIPANYRMLDEP